MAQTDSLIKNLKRVLKGRGLTYRDVARNLKISEASVKRLFANGTFSLQRVEQILNLAHTTFGHLVQMMEAEQHSLEELSEAQERELASDPALLLVAFVVINGWHYEDVLSDYSFSPHVLTRHLAKLDRLKLIELLPKNRIQLRISARFHWRKHGPIKRFFDQHLQRDFLNSRFNGTHEQELFLTGVLTDASRIQLQSLIDELTHRFLEFSHRDRFLPLQERRLCSLMLAIRPWRPAVFDRFLKIK